jgi:hypothetical protein
VWCSGPSCQPLRGLGSASASLSEKTKHRIEEEKEKEKKGEKDENRKSVDENGASNGQRDQIEKRLHDCDYEQ